MSDVDLAVFKMHANICKTLANPTRLMILNFLRDDEKSVSELAQLVGARQANVSQHLAVLRQREIVTTRKQGTNIYYSVANAKIIRACDMIRQVLFEQLAKAKELTEKYAKNR